MRVAVEAYLQRLNIIDNDREAMVRGEGARRQRARLARDDDEID
jgi:hypothetical protein